ncbi:MAG: metallophosphoesterase [Cyclobacteriaceae bacterium]
MVNAQSKDTANSVQLTNSEDYKNTLTLQLDDKLLFPSHRPDRVILNLTEDPLHSVAVNWRTDTSIASGNVEIAEATDGQHFLQNTHKVKAMSEYLKVSYPEEPDVEAHYHSAIIDGLTPGNTYLYRVGLGAYYSEWFQFTMPDPEEQGLSFLYLGDAQNEVKSQWSRVFREAYKTLPNADFILHPGDLVNRGNRDIEWGEWFYAGGFIHANIPSLMVPGNHEYGKDMVLAPQWKAQFNLPDNGPNDLKETCYQVNFPALKILTLDSDQIDESNVYLKSQLYWMDSVLKHDPREWIILMLHHPFYSTKSNRDNSRLREHFKPLIDQYGIDLVLQGHDHGYGRGMVSKAQKAENLKAQNEEVGTMYVVSVSGPKMYDVLNEPWMHRKAENIQFFHTITIKGKELVFKSFTAKGELYDAFHLLKEKGKSNILVNKIPDTPEER